MFNPPAVCYSTGKSAIIHRDAAFFIPDHHRSTKDRALMTIEQRRSERIVDFLPLEIHVVHGQDGRMLAGPFSGRIIDISAHGACLLMTQIMNHGFHVFHSTRDTDEAVLRLTIDQPPDLGPHILTAHPIWLDIFRQGEIRAFKMGVEFTEDPEKKQMRELRAAMRRNQEARGAWWRKHYRV